VSLLAEDADDPRPVMPPAPEAGACCQSGCDPCVYDRYWDEMTRYEQALADWESRHLAPGTWSKNVEAEKYS
jgi:hypothetical protein